MPMLLRNIKLRLDEPEESLPARIGAVLRIPASAVRCYAVVHRSLDARDQNDPHFVYHVELALHDAAQERRLLTRLRPSQGIPISPAANTAPEPGQEPLRHRPIIVGFGPAGMFAALRLAEYGYQPIVLERGQPVRTRHRDVMQRFYREHDFDPESNLLFGEGGAGTYSDGKLYTRVHQHMVREILETFYHHGADPDILIDSKPHVGSDKLPTICTRIRRRIESLGGEVRFGRRLEDIETGGAGIDALIVNGERMPAEAVLLGIGHSARDTLLTLIDRGVCVVPKPFQIGVRIEHPQALVQRWQYGPLCSHGLLPPADYQLVAKGVAGPNRDLFSFCMCPGGTILPTHESPGLIATNGASKASRNGPFANSGLVMTIEPDMIGNDPVAGIRYQEKWERLAFAATAGTYRVPAQRAADFVERRSSDGRLETSYPLGAAWADIRGIIPPDVAAALVKGLAVLDRKLPGYAGMDGIVTGPETRASSPARIQRDPQTRQSVSTPGLYPVGEGAGYAGGIISSAIDGLKSADVIIQRYRPLER